MSFMTTFPVYINCLSRETSAVYWNNISDVNEILVYCF